MNTLNHCWRVSVNSIAISIFCLLLSIWTPLNAADSQSNTMEESSAFHINATIMEINLNKNFMVIAEKYIFLKHTVQDGKKQWQTEFLNAKGQKITVTAFAKKDRVNVDGTVTTSEKIVADKITLLESAAVPAKNVGQGAEVSSEQSSSPQFVNGVWKN